MTKFDVDELKDSWRDILYKIEAICTRLYHPGMSARGAIRNIIDYVGDRNAAIIAAVLSLLIIWWSFSLFAVFFAIFFALFVTAGIFIIVKLIFYKPQKYSVKLRDNKRVLSFIKHIHLNGESEILVHSQFDNKNKQKDTFIVLQLLETLSVLDCHNIVSIRDKSYRDILISFFHPLSDSYLIHIPAEYGAVNFEIVHQTPDQCRIRFQYPLYEIIRIEFKQNQP